MGSSAFALCLCNILLTSLAYTLLEDVINGSDSGIYGTANGHATPNGFSSPRRLHIPTNSMHVALQNLSATIALGCAVASILLEKHAVNGLTYRRELGFLGGSWKRDMRQLDFGQGFSMCLVGALNGYLTVSAVSRKLINGFTERSILGSCITHTKSCLMPHLLRSTRLSLVVDLASTAHFEAASSCAPLLVSRRCQLDCLIPSHSPSYTRKTLLT